MPSARMRLLHAGRPLKRWRYVGVFSEQLMACAALVQVGPARQSFWALYRREHDELRERTRLLPRRSALQLIRGTRSGGGRPGEPGRLLIDDAGVRLDLRLEEDDGFEARCANGAGYVWTRKQAGIAASGTLALDGRRAEEIHALAVIDDTAGYHARRTEWWWSAGVGHGPDGAPVAWNLVSGVNDPPSGSERAVWLDGAPREAPPVAFTADLKRIACEDGSRLRFHAEAERARKQNLLIFKSDYQAPFGSFSGSLPGAIPLAHGLGVVEHHRALW
jgi:hypothetical protein